MLTLLVSEWFWHLSANTLNHILHWSQVHHACRAIVSAESGNPIGVEWSSSAEQSFRCRVKIRNIQVPSHSWSRARQEYNRSWVSQFCYMSWASVSYQVSSNTVNYIRVCEGTDSIVNHFYGRHERILKSQKVKIESFSFPMKFACNQWEKWRRHATNQHEASIERERKIQYGS